MFNTLHASTCPMHKGYRYVSDSSHKKIVTLHPGRSCKFSYYLYINFLDISSHGMARTGPVTVDLHHSNASLSCEIITQKSVIHLLTLFSQISSQSSSFLMSGIQLLVLVTSSLCLLDTSPSKFLPIPTFPFVSSSGSVGFCVTFSE